MADVCSRVHCTQTCRGTARVRDIRGKGGSEDAVALRLTMVFNAHGIERSFARARVCFCCAGSSYSDSSRGFSTRGPPCRKRGACVSCGVRFAFEVHAAAIAGLMVEQFWGEEFSGEEGVRENDGRKFTKGIQYLENAGIVAVAFNWKQKKTAACPAGRCKRTLL